ncbi:TPA: Arc family DNA-binding protein [Citrobacter koseri]|nr:Arc family DNA-binding protein [Citrobacter koseri]HDQ2604475.1 Arc family DNA-binding protein [Citrobacter koseri]
MSEKFPSQMQDKFTVRFPDGLRDAIAERAKRNGRSMNSEIVQILEDALSKDGDYIPPLGSGDPNEQFFAESYINGRFERLEGTLKEIIEKLERSGKKPT